VTHPPHDAPDHPARHVVVDKHWLRAVVFTLILVGLVAAAMGGDWPFAFSALAVCGVGFGFFYLVFPGGASFGVTMANCLAVYACLFEYFREANFTAAPHLYAITALGLPLLAFLAGCFARRTAIATSILAHRQHEMSRLPRTRRWLPAIAAISASSFLLPQFSLSPVVQGEALLGGMTVVGLVIGLAARDVVLLLVDIAQVFDTVSRRMYRLLMPVLAFLTYYSLLVVIFASLYRIAEMSLGAAQFQVHGHLAYISFADALYFSVITIATVGYGDITPAGPLVRGLASIEVVAGLLLLLFGFSEIMRPRDHKE
jgi:voltage-gated potassium channel